jgi:hypothetical protein
MLKLPLLIAATLLTLSINAHAEVKTRLTCVTSEPTTSYVILEDEKGYELQALQHNGVGYMPIHDGTITSNDLAYIAKNAEVLKKLGARMKVRFEKSECKVGEREWICSNRKTATIGEQTVQGVWFKVSPRRIITRLIDYTTYRADFSILKDGTGYSSPMNYDIDDCVFR